MSEPEQSGSKWAKTLHPDLGNELVRRWDAHERLEAEIGRLRAALRDARNYVEAVALNTPDHKKKRNYRDCVVRIDAALEGK